MAISTPLTVKENWDQITVQRHRNEEQVGLLLYSEDDIVLEANNGYLMGEGGGNILNLVKIYQSMYTIS